MFVSPKHARSQWVRSKNGNQWQTMYDGARHTCRFLNSEQKHLIGEVCLQASNCFKSKAKVVDVLGEMQCSIVCNGKRYYLPFL